MAETAITELIPRDRSERESLGMRVSVLVERAGSADCETMTGQLHRVTPGEITVLVTPPLDLDQVVSLRIKVPQLQFDLLVAAAVCTTRSVDQFRGELTCTLDPELPGDALARLAVDSHAAASTQQRKPRSVRARVSWAPDVPASPVRIQSLVGTGLRMASTQTAQPGARLTLHFDTPDGTSAAIPVLMCWQLRTAERYLIGCALENRDDARSARQAIRWLQTHRRGHSKPPRRGSLRHPQRWRNVLTLATCAAVTAAAVVLLLARGPLASTLSAMTTPRPGTSSSAGSPVGDLAETLSQLADQVAAHDRQLTDLNHTLQVAQTDGQAAQRQSQRQWRDEQTELAKELSRLDGSLNQLTQRLTGIQRDQQNLLRRQRALADQIVAAAAQITVLQQRPPIVAAPPAAAEHRATAAVGAHRSDTATVAEHNAVKRPSAAAQRPTHVPIEPTATATRVWSDSSGSHHVAAVLVDAVDGTARLRIESGRVLGIPIARLSRADQQFIAAWMAKRPAK
jgi:hypothetical protein